MKHPTSSVTLLKAPAAISLIAALCAFTGTTWAQIQTGTGPSQNSQANPLPLSGRTGQTGSVKATQLPVPGTTTSVNTINPSVQVQGPYTGSVQGAGSPMALSLREAIQRGIQYNLGTVSETQAVRQAKGQSRSIRSSLLPNLNGYSSDTVEQLNLRALGLGTGSIFPGITIPSIVGPFNFFDLRATLSQTLVDRTAWNNYRSAKETVRANQMWSEDARDLVVLAVGGAYLQVISAQAKVISARAQLETANALYEQTLEQRRAGIVPQTDVNRSQIQSLTERQRLLSLENDLAKQRISLARMTGLPLSAPFDLSDDVPYSPEPSMPLQSALNLAFEQRSDLRASEAQVRAAERYLAAARAERLPALALKADYGVTGINPGQSHGTFAVSARVDFPIFKGGRIEGDIEQAEAVLDQRKAERDDIVRQIESDVRNAYLDLQASREQVEVARTNIQVTQQNLELTRQRFDAGVSDNVEVVQSQESVATAQWDYINSVFAHNLSKLALLRATGSPPDRLAQFLAVR